MAQPGVPRPDPWGVLGVTEAPHVPESRSEPETVTELDVAGLPCSGRIRSVSCWAGTRAIGASSSEVASAVPCPAQPALSMVIGPYHETQCPRCNRSVCICSLARENVLAELIGPREKTKPKCESGECCRSHLQFQHPGGGRSRSSKPWNGPVSKLPGKIKNFHYLFNLHLSAPTLFLLVIYFVSFSIHCWCGNCQGQTALRKSNFLFH